VHARAQGNQVEVCVAQHVEAQRARQRGELLEAREQLLMCAQRDCPALVSNDCTTWLAEVEASVPTIVLAVVDERGGDVRDVKVTANGRPLAEQVDGKALALDPGSYELSFEAPGHVPLTTQLTVHQAEKNRIVRVQLARAPAPAPVDDGPGVPVLSYVLGGAAVVGIGTFAYFGLTGAAEHRDAQDSCAPVCSAARVKDIERSYLIADVGLAVGLASAAAAVLVYFTGQAEEREDTARLELSPSRAGATLLWSGRF